MRKQAQRLRAWLGAADARRQAIAGRLAASVARLGRGVGRGQPPSSAAASGANASGRPALVANGGRQLRRLRSRTAALLQRLPGGVRPWIALVTLGFVMAVLFRNSRDLLQLQLDGQGLLWLVLGGGLTLASLMANGLALGALLAWLGQGPRWQEVLTLFISTNLRKYLPGGVWHLASRFEALRGAQAPLERPLKAAVALQVVLLEPLLAAVAALLLVVSGGWQDGLALLALAPLLLLRPAGLRRLLPVLEARRARDLGLEEPAVAVGPLPLPGYPWPPLLAQLLFVLLRFSGFACCVWAFDLQDIIPWTTWLAGFALAWTAGLVVPGAPGGLGVFEAVLLLRLRVVLPDSQLLAIALSYRLISTAADLLAAALVGIDQQLPGLLQGSSAAGRLSLEKRPRSRPPAWLQGGAAAVVDAWRGLGRALPPLRAGAPTAGPAGPDASPPPPVATPEGEHQPQAPAVGGPLRPFGRWFAGLRQRLPWLRRRPGDGQPPPTP
ncbi:MAG: hypothetical protein VKK62_06195 [Synechococcaceae cyanobacterium]|nr:hypothetical protein [Synechococcaceae cyanobacterium]